MRALTAADNLNFECCLEIAAKVSESCIPERSLLLGNVRGTHGISLIHDELYIGARIDDRDRELASLRAVSGMFLEAVDRLQRLSTAMKVHVLNDDQWAPALQRLPSDITSRRWDISAHAILAPNVNHLVDMWSRLSNIRDIGVEAKVVSDPPLLLEAFRLFCSTYGTNVSVVRWHCPSVDVTNVVHELLDIEEFSFTSMEPNDEVPIALAGAGVAWDALKKLKVYSVANDEGALWWNEALKRFTNHNFPALTHFELQGTEPFVHVAEFIHRNEGLEYIVLGRDSVGGGQEVPMRIHTLPLLETFGFPMTMLWNTSFAIQPSLRRIILFDHDPSVIDFPTPKSREFVMRYYNAVWRIGIIKRTVFPILDTLVLYDFPLEMMASKQWTKEAIIMLRGVVRSAKKLGLETLDMYGRQFRPEVALETVPEEWHAMDCICT